jgi:type IV secretory pathway TrbD component
MSAMSTTATSTLASALDREAAERRLAIIGVAAIAVIGAGIRLWNINSVGLNSDEAVYSGQAAALAGDAGLQQFFAIFRAHPLLVQFMLSILYQFGVNDVAGRILSVGFGVAAIGLTYALGTLLFSRRVALLAAAALAVLPYHVAVSRQILLDGPEMTMWLLATYFLARYAASGLPRWLYAAAFAAGLTVLAKETAVLVVVVGIAFGLMTPAVRLGAQRLGIAAAAFLLALSPYPASILLSVAGDTARQFLLWQILRQPNHTGTFYFEVLGSAIGPVLLVLAALGVIAAVRTGGWQDRLLLAWVFVPLAFFETWPVKGYQYLLPIAPALALLAARTLDAPWTTWFGDRFRRLGLHPQHMLGARALASILVPALLLLSLAPTTIATVMTTSAQGSLAGTGGLPGGREAGLWIRDNVPPGATFMTIGPTMSNIIKFYGQRKSYGLSVSPNPLRRNPAYDPILNPDRSLQTLQIHYAAFDVWSASRSPFFSATLRRYITKYKGRLVYEQHAVTRDLDGTVQDQVVIQIYQLRP